MPRELLVVEAELEDVGRLRVPRELRVERLVAPRAERRRRLDAQQEVGDPAPAAVDEDALVDDVGAAAERLLGRGDALVPVAVGDLDRNVPAFGAELLEVGALVLLALALDQLGLRVATFRAVGVSLAAARRRQVLAREEAAQVGRREQQRSVATLHRDGLSRSAPGVDLPASTPHTPEGATRMWSILPRCRVCSAILNPMVQYPTTVDRAFAALADPTRRAVLERLGAGNATISELAEPFGMSLTGMKKHIRLLEEAELVTTEKVGRARRCTLVPYAFEGISTWLQRLDRFAQVVERTKGAR